MNITRPLLSVCIPTYNRIGYLLENLNVLMPQVKNCQSVEVLVNDNGSTDNTSGILKAKCEENNWNIDIKRNDENIYFIDNFKDVIDRSAGKYIFLLGDDDILSPDFLSAVLPILNEERYSILHFNRLIGNENCSLNHLHDREFKEVKEDLPFEEFVSRVMSSPNFMSSQIFSRIVWEKGAKYYRTDRYYGYEFLSREYFGALGSRCLYYYMPLVLMRNPVRTWTRQNFLYIMIGMFNIFNDLDNEIPGVKEKWAHRIRRTHFYDFHLMLNCLSRDRDLYRQYRKNINEICINCSEKLTVRFLLDFPGAKLTSFLYPKLLKIYRLVRSKYRLERKIDF